MHMMHACYVYMYIHMCCIRLNSDAYATMIILLYFSYDNIPVWIYIILYTIDILLSDNIPEYDNIVNATQDPFSYGAFSCAGNLARPAKRNPLSDCDLV